MALSQPKTPSGIFLKIKIKNENPSATNLTEDKLITLPPFLIYSHFQSQMPSAGVGILETIQNNWRKQLVWQDNKEEHLKWVVLHRITILQSVGTSITKFSSKGILLLHSMRITWTKPQPTQKAVTCRAQHGPWQPALLPLLLESRTGNEGAKRKRSLRQSYS